MAQTAYYFCGAVGGAVIDNDDFQRGVIPVTERIFARCLL
jgi:hypothetical protein